MNLEGVNHGTVAVVEIQYGCLCAGLQHSSELLQRSRYAGDIPETIAHCDCIKSPVCKAQKASGKNWTLLPLNIDLMRKS